jgi:hypothetical protein
VLFYKNNLPTTLKVLIVMDNKKLLKFLFKDISEIEELVCEKGTNGFDEFEIEFIQSRFKGAKHIIQILSEKENKQLKEIRPRPAVAELNEDLEILPSHSQLREDDVESLPTQSPSQFAMEKGGDPFPVEAPEEESVRSQMTEEETESLQSLTELEDELNDEIAEEISAETSEFEESESVAEEEPEVVEAKNLESEFAEPEDPQDSNVEQAKSDVEMDDDDEEEGNANHRLGDSFLKEKSVNDLLINGNSKLEYKISNSPVVSIKASIGINDKYQYIRELFKGNADNFSTAVNELDGLNSIQEAVAYLQQNYKWKKNETSLKFVNLVKRRFPNG